MMTTNTEFVSAAEATPSAVSRMQFVRKDGSQQVHTGLCLLTLYLDDPAKVTFQYQNVFGALEDLGFYYIDMISAYADHFGMRLSTKSGEGNREWLLDLLHELGDVSVLHPKFAQRFKYNVVKQPDGSFKLQDVRCRLCVLQELTKKDNSLWSKLGLRKSLVDKGNFGDIRQAIVDFEGYVANYDICLHPPPLGILDSEFPFIQTPYCCATSNPLGTIQSISAKLRQRYNRQTKGRRMLANTITYGNFLSSILDNTLLWTTSYIAVFFGINLWTVPYLTPLMYQYFWPAFFVGFACVSLGLKEYYKVAEKYMVRYYLSRIPHWFWLLLCGVIYYAIDSYFRKRKEKEDKVKGKVTNQSLSTKAYYSLVSFFVGAASLSFAAVAKDPVLSRYLFDLIKSSSIFSNLTYFLPNGGCINKDCKGHNFSTRATSHCSTCITDQICKTVGKFCPGNSQVINDPYGSAKIFINMGFNQDTHEFKPPLWYYNLNAVSRALIKDRLGLKEDENISDYKYVECGIKHGSLSETVIRLSKTKPTSMLSKIGPTGLGGPNAFVYDLESLPVQVDNVEVDREKLEKTINYEEEFKQSNSNKVSANKTTSSTSEAATSSNDATQSANSIKIPTLEQNFVSGGIIRAPCQPKVVMVNGFDDLFEDTVTGLHSIKFRCWLAEQYSNKLVAKFSDLGSDKSLSKKDVTDILDQLPHKFSPEYVDKILSVTATWNNRNVLPLYTANKNTVGNYDFLFIKKTKPSLAVSIDDWNFENSNYKLSDDFVDLRYHSKEEEVEDQYFDEYSIKLKELYASFKDKVSEHYRTYACIFIFFFSLIGLAIVFVKGRRIHDQSFSCPFKSLNRPCLIKNCRDCSLEDQSRGAGAGKYRRVQKERHDNDHSSQLVNKHFTRRDEDVVVGKHSATSGKPQGFYITYETNLEKINKAFREKPNFVCDLVLTRAVDGKIVRSYVTANSYQKVEEYMNQGYRICFNYSNWTNLSERNKRLLPGVTGLTIPDDHSLYLYQDVMRNIQSGLNFDSTNRRYQYEFVEDLMQSKIHPPHEFSKCLYEKGFLNAKQYEIYNTYLKAVQWFKSSNSAFPKYEASVLMDALRRPDELNFITRMTPSVASDFFSGQVIEEDQSSAAPSVQDESSDVVKSIKVLKRQIDSAKITDQSVSTFSPINYWPNTVCVYEEHTDGSRSYLGCGFCQGKIVTTVKHNFINSFGKYRAVSFSFLVPKKNSDELVFEEVYIPGRCVFDSYCHDGVDLAHFELSDEALHILAKAGRPTVGGVRIKKKFNDINNSGCSVLPINTNLDPCCYSGQVLGTHNSGGFDYIRANYANTDGFSGAPVYTHDGHLLGIHKGRLEQSENNSIFVPLSISLAPHLSSLVNGSLSILHFRSQLPKVLDDLKC